MRSFVDCPIDYANVVVGATVAELGEGGGGVGAGSVGADDDGGRRWVEVVEEAAEGRGARRWGDDEVLDLWRGRVVVTLLGGLYPARCTRVAFDQLFDIIGDLTGDDEACSVFGELAEKCFESGNVFRAARQDRIGPG